MPNAYEEARDARIAANKARMAALGLGAGGSHAVAALAPLPSTDAPLPFPPGGRRANKRRVPREPAPRPPSARASRRLRGFNADGTPASDPVFVAPLRDPDLDDPDASRGGGSKRRGLPFPDPSDFPDSLGVFAPFTLRSIGVTVESLGVVHRAAFAPAYWSSKGCLFHHAYPVGYVATKTHFGRAWRMSIEAGEVGPVFKVTDIVSGRCYEGETPTKPWTAACVATRTRTRISGPLFFGFSDPATMRALAHLYTREEIHACKTGERVQVKVRGVRASSEPTLDAITDAVGAERVFDPAPPEKDSAGASDAGRESARLERFVGAIRRDVEGCGYQAALALARTRSLSRHVDAPRAEPRRLVDVAELRSVPSEALRAFLLESEEVPAATRRWPAWRLRVAETIVRALAAGDDEGAEGDSIDEEDIKGRAIPRAGGKENADEALRAR